MPLADLLHVGERMEPVPGPPAASPPAEPTAEELRARLLGARQRLEAAQQAHKAATDAYARGKAHLHQCEVEARSFEPLEAEIAAATLAALRGPEGKPSMAPFEQRIGQRQVAEAGLVAAQAAEIELLAEVQAPAAEVAEAERVERLAVNALIALAHAPVQAEAARREAAVEAVRQVLRRGYEAEPWAGMAVRLRADPLGASLDVGEMPAEPVAEAVRPSPVRAFVDEIVVMLPGGGTEVITHAEAAASARAARNVGHSDPVELARREDEARRQAQRGPLA
jgi:hypothetical protein